MFIFTSAVNCPEILKVMLNSYLAYHMEPIHVYVDGKSYSELHQCYPENVKIIKVGNDVIAGYKKGHHGTALLWAKILREHRDERIVHIDSDVIFLKKSISICANSSANIGGAVRRYKKIGINRSPDAIATHFMFIDSRFVNVDNLATHQLVRMCEGGYDPEGKPTIDFFDPVFFYAVKGGAEVEYFNREIAGGYDDSDMDNRNVAELLNQDLDAGYHLLHFAGIASGLSFQNKLSSAPVPYMKWAVPRYLMWKWLFIDRRNKSPSPLAEKLDAFIRGTSSKFLLPKILKI